MSSDQTFEHQDFHDQTFDPTQVAKYPVYQLFYEDLTGDTGADDGADAVDRASRVELDGIRVEPAPGQGLREAAVAAIAKKATDHQRDAVRVIVTNAENERWKMIVTAEGKTIDLSDDHGRETKTRRSKKPLLVAGGGLLVLTVAASVTAVVLISDTPDDEAAGTETSGTESSGAETYETETSGAGAEATAWKAPNAGAEVPVGLPDDYAPTATWVTPVMQGSGVMELSSDKLSNDTLAVIDSEGSLQAIDAQTAQPQWYSTQAPEEMAEVHETTWAGEPVLAEATSSQLRLWPIPTDSQPAPTSQASPDSQPVQPHTVELAHQADVTFVGDSPLIDLGDYVVAADAGDGTLTEVQIPAGAEPLLVSDGEVVSMDDTHLYHSPINPDENQASDDQDSDSTEQGSESAELAHHSAVDNDRPEAVWPLNPEVVAGLYEGVDDQPIMQVFNLDGERITSSYLEPAPTGHDPALLDAQAETAVIGSVGISWGGEPGITELTPPREPLLHGTTLWGETTNGPARLDITDQDPEPQAYEAFSEEDPPPVLVTDQAAYVEAPRVDQTLLYRAEHHHRTEHQSSAQTDTPGNDDHNEQAEDDEEDGDS